MQLRHAFVGVDFDLLVGGDVVWSAALEAAPWWKFSFVFGEVVLIEALLVQ